MDKKKNLFKAFTQDVTYNYHVIKTEEPDGHLIYLIKNGEALNEETLEFSPTRIVEKLVKDCDVKIEKFAPAIFFTETLNTDELKYKLNDSLSENEEFSSFIETIKDEYRKLEVKDSLLFKKDPEAYEKAKKEEHDQHQKELFDEMLEQMKEKTEKREKHILSYDNNIMKLLKDYFQDIIEYETNDFDFDKEFEKLISNLANDTWVKVDEKPFVCKVKIVSLETNKINVFLTDNVNSYTVSLNFDKTELITENIIKVENSPKIMTDYEILSQLYDINIDSVEEWNFKNETDRIKYVIDYLVPIFKQEKKEKEEKFVEKVLEQEKSDKEKLEELGLEELVIDNLEEHNNKFKNNNKNVKQTKPIDYVFNVLVPEDMDEMNPSVIAFMEKNFWEQNNFFDDQMGSHRLSQNIIDALNNAGIEGDVELMESVWAVADCESKTEQNIIDSMIKEGFIYVPDMK